MTSNVVLENLRSDVAEVLDLLNGKANERAAPLSQIKLWAAYAPGQIRTPYILPLVFTDENSARSYTGYTIVELTGSYE